MKSLFSSLLVALAAFLSLRVSAQENAGTQLAIETDPSTFAFGGYALHLRVKPRNSDHLMLGAGTYAMDFPAAFVNMNAHNKDAGWNVRINGAVALFGEYYFKEAGKGLLAGVQAGVQQYKIGHESVANTQSKYENFLLMPSIGYNVRPFSFPLYVKFWGGLGYTIKIAGSNQVGSQIYDIAPLIPFGALHVGWLFGK